MTRDHGVLGSTWSEFRLPDSAELPDVARQELRAIWDARHIELADESTTEELDASVARMLGVLGPPTQAAAHVRHVYLALALALAAQPTLDHFAPGDQPELIVSALRRWLVMPSDIDSNPAAALGEAPISTSQAVDDARSLFFEAGRALRREHARSALFTMIDDALTGEAITAYRDDRRRIYNWLITEAVPAAFLHHEPARLPTRDRVTPNRGS